MKKSISLLSIVLIAILLINIFLPIVLANSEVVNNETNNVVYNTTDLTENKIPTENNVTEKEETNIEKNENKIQEDNIIKGKELLHTYCKNKGIDLSPLLRNEYTEACMHKYGFRDWESVCAAIGHGGLKEGQVVNKLQDEYNKKNKRAAYNAHIHEMLEGVKTQRTEGSGPSQQSSSKKKSGIIVEGLDDLAVRFSKCCSPVPGDEIVGFITRGRGMSIHRTDCVNIIHLSEAERARLIPAEWEKPEEGTDTGSYLAEIKMYANDRQGLLMDTSKVFTEMNIDVKSMNVRTSKQGTATIEAGFIVRGREELGKVIGKLRQIVGVLDIERAVG